MNESEYNIEKDLYEKAETVLSLCRERGLTLGTAESCTGGLLGGCLTAVPGASDVFRGSIVAYSNEVKRKLLGVSAKTLAEFGAVSTFCATEMALGASKALDVDVAVSVTGIAGPGGGSIEKPVGTVCFAFGGPGLRVIAQEKAHESRFPSDDRRLIRLNSCMFALDTLAKTLLLEPSSTWTPRSDV